MEPKVSANGNRAHYPSTNEVIASADNYNIEVTEQEFLRITECFEKIVAYLSTREGSGRDGGSVGNEMNQFLQKVSDTDPDSATIEVINAINQAQEVRENFRTYIDNNYLRIMDALKQFFIQTNAETEGLVNIFKEMSNLFSAHIK